MKKVVACFLLLTSVVLAQRGAGLGTGPSAPAAARQQPPMTPSSSSMRTSAIGYGFGNVIFPSTGNPASRSYTPYGIPPGRQGSDGIRNNRAAIIPIAVPVYVGGYGYDYAPVQQQQPIQVIMPQQPQSPTVIINQNFTSDTARPVMRDYSAGIPSVQEDVNRTPAAEEKPTVYLIAFRDGSIYSAYAYWQEGESFHYITTKHDHNQASLDLIDTAMSESLNKERNVEFKVRK